jgi:hypothetical protein
MKVVNRPPLIFRAVTTWRRAKLVAVAVSMIGIPLWLGAKLMPRYSEKTACCTAMKASALSGKSTHSTTVRYSAACSVMREASTAEAWSRCRKSRLIRVRAYPASQQHEGEEERRLPACQPRRERAAPVSRRRRGQGDCSADIGVAAHLVGMRMVGVVLVNPPAEAQPDEHVSYGEAEQAIAPARAEYLAVPRIMADEAELGEDNPRPCGDGEGRPRVAGDNEQDPSGQEGRRSSGLSSPGSSRASGRADPSLAPAAPAHES